MPIDKDLEKNSEINLNVKIPQDDSDSGFSMRDIILTVYYSRRLFFICCIIGLLLGLVAAVYLFTASVPAGDVTVSITLSYSKPQEHIFPTGETFDVSSFYTRQLWENALKTIGRGNISAENAINQVDIINKNVFENTPEDGSIIVTDDSILILNAVGAVTSRIENSIEGNTYLLTIPSTNNSIFKTNEEKKEILLAFGNEYKDYITSRFYNENRIGMMNGQYLKLWVDITKEDIVPNPYSYGANFDMISQRYEALCEILLSLYDEDPMYVSADGKNFSEYANEFEDIIYKDLATWRERLNYDVYIRNPNQFSKNYEFARSSLQASSKYYQDLLQSYNSLLLSFQQPDTNGIGFQEAVELLLTAQETAADASDVQKQLSQMDALHAAFGNNNQTILTNSNEAEQALTAFYTGLEQNQANLNNIIRDYYIQNIDDIAENAVMFSIQPSDDTNTGNLTTVVLVFILLTLLGVAVGLGVVLIKKHLPEKEQA